MRSTFKGNDKLAYGVVLVLVTRFLEAFTFTQKLSKTQIEVFTVDTLEHFAFESLEDVILFFKMARSGKFGTAKKGIDSNLVFSDWFPQFMELKSLAREEHRARTKPNAIAATPQAVQRTYNKIYRESKHKQSTDYVDRITARFNRDDLEALIVKWELNDSMIKYVPYLKAKRRQIKD